MRSERGFTLLEVVIALTIAVIAVSALFRGISTGLGAVRTAGRYEEAVSRAKSHLAALGHDGPLVEGELNGDDGRGFHWRSSVQPIGTSKPKPQDTQGFALPQPPPVGLYAVIVGISWTDGGRRREVVLRTERVGKPSGGHGG